MLNEIELKIWSKIFHLPITLVLVLVLVLVQLSTVQAGLLLGSLTWRCSSSGRRLIFADGASVKRDIVKLYTTFATSIHYIT